MLVSDRIIHISHNDLDGYASQFAVSRAFYNVAYFNGNYHELDNLIAAALKQIKLEILANQAPKLLLITDVNLKAETCNHLQKQLQKLPIKVDLQLLDHHATGKDCAERFEWYHLDTRYCATRLTYQWLKPWLTKELDVYLDAFSDLVNVTDLWLQDDDRFNMANFMADIIFQKPLVIEEMQEAHRNYLFYCLFRIFAAYQNGDSLESIERNLYDFQLDFLQENHIDTSIVRDPNIGLENKYHALILDYLKSNKPNIITIDGYKVALFFRWNGTIFQHISSTYLKQNKHIDIAMRVGSNARLSLRTQQADINVGDLARRYFFGGGHPQAAGGMLKVKEISQLQGAIKLIEKATSIPVHKRNEA